MGLFTKKKAAPVAEEPATITTTTKAAELAGTSIESPLVPTATKTPPPCYSTMDSVSAPTDTTADPGEVSMMTSKTSTLDNTTTSRVFSPDEFKGATRQPTISGERIIVAKHQAPPINDSNLPEVVIPHTHTGESNNTQSVASDSRLSLLRSPPSMTYGDSTVTPLHLLSDQSDMVDCPFCRRRAETRVEKVPSAATHASAAGLFLVSVGGVVIPYKKQWKHHISHYCTNCSRKVASQRNGEKTMQALGTPEHLREASRFPPAASQLELRSAAAS